jgi:hypothetical protein
MKLAMEKARNKDGRELMRDYVKAYVKFAVHNREYYDLMYGGKVWRSQNLTRSLISSARSTLRSNVERIQSWQDRGQIAQDVDVLRFAQVSWGTQHGISRLFIDGIYTDSASVNRICETAADMLWSQLSPA